MEVLVLILGCHGFWRADEVYLIVRLRLQAGVESGGVVKRDVVADARARLADRVVSVQVHLLVLDRSPDAFDEDVVAPAAPSVQADPDAFPLQSSGEGLAGELRSLVGVEYLRFSIHGKRLFQRLHAEGRIHRDQHTPGQHAAAEPVHHRGQIDEAARHRGDVHGPDLVGPRDGHVTQQVGINPVTWCGFRRVRPAIDGLNGYLPHQRSDMPATYFKTLLPEQVAQHAATRKRVVQMQLVDLGVVRLHIDDRLLRARLAEDTGGAFQQLRLPLRNLVGMHVELLGLLRQRPITLHRRQSHLRLERR